MKNIVKNWELCYNAIMKGGNSIMNGTALLSNCYDYARKNELSTDENDIKRSNFNRLKFHYELRKFVKTQEFKEYFENNKEILEGKTVIKGTRITPETIFDYLCLKMKPTDKDVNGVAKRVLKAYPTITEKQVIYSAYYTISKWSYMKVLFL